MFKTIGNTGVPVPVYGIMAALGILACYILLKFTHKYRNGIDTIEYAYTGLWAGLGAFIVSHLFFAVAQHQKVLYGVTHLTEIFSSMKTLLIFLNDIFGGMVFYGGLIGACIGGYVYMKKNKLNIAQYTDTAVPCIPLFHAFGRAGCFLAGCCYGVESKFGIVYHYAVAESANGVRRFPIQLAEAVENIILCIILFIVLKRAKKIPHGALLWIYGMTYPVMRFINEFFRGDYAERGYFGILSTSQWISIVIFGISCFMFFRALHSACVLNP